MTIRLRTFPMSHAQMYLLGLAALIVLSASADAQVIQAGGAPQPPLMDREKEIALALSSCPPSIASQATVYALEKAGYVKVRDGQNGFTAIVQHVRPTSLEPQCMDAEGARAFLPRMLKVAELRSRERVPTKSRPSCPTHLQRVLSLRRRGRALFTCYRARTSTPMAKEKLSPHT